PPTRDVAPVHLLAVFGPRPDPALGTERSKSPQPLNLQGPAISPPALQQGGVYRIFHPKGQTQIVRAESPADFGGGRGVSGEGQKLAAPVGRAVGGFDQPC